MLLTRMLSVFFSLAGAFASLALSFFPACYSDKLNFLFLFMLKNSNCKLHLETYILEFEIDTKSITTPT